MKKDGNKVTFHKMVTEKSCGRKIGENMMLFTVDKMESVTNETKTLYVSISHQR